MVITISPGSRDSKFNDLATLKIKHKNGTVDTPNRLVNKHDHSAKDAIGANIPLTRTSKSFIIQENIDPDILNNIFTKNGYLNQILTKTKTWADKIGNKNALVFLYPNLTKDAKNELDTPEKRKKFSRFFSNLATEMNIESIMLPVINTFDEIKSSVNLKDLQIIPIIELQDPTEEFTKKFNDCKSEESEDVPILGFKFAPYPKANIAYDMIMDEFDKIHEKSKAVMIVNSERYLRANTSRNVSGPHYGSFIVGDLIAERFITVRGSSDRKSVRFFCKNDLVNLPNTGEEIKSKFDVKSEKKVFQNDPKLQDLLTKLMENSTNSEDWKQNRPFYLSRVHENVRTRDEFDNLKKNIDSRTSTEYLEEKKDMNMVIKDHLKERLTK